MIYASNSLRDMITKQMITCM